MCLYGHRQAAGKKALFLLDGLDEIKTEYRDIVVNSFANFRIKNEEYWDDKGKKWFDQNKIEQPEYWNDRKYKCPNAPVAGVSWYEACAFTRWLTIELNDEYEYKLLSENEWEAAASGHEGKKYPWGSEWDKNKCNNSDIQIRRTSPVGIFKGGNTPEGISDFSGNMFEWTDSLFSAKIGTKVCRGGSWSFYSSVGASVGCCNASRTGFGPDSRHHGIGFRCARTGG